jgi:hypothetical protein
MKEKRTEKRLLARHPRSGNHYMINDWASLSSFTFPFSGPTICGHEVVRYAQS